MGCGCGRKSSRSMTMPGGRSASPAAKVVGRSVVQSQGSPNSSSGQVIVSPTTRRATSVAPRTKV